MYIIQHDTDCKCNVTISDNENNNVTCAPGSCALWKRRIRGVSGPLCSDQSRKHGIKLCN